MSDVWEIMAHPIELPIAYDDPVQIPSGWEPIGILPRQGNKAVVLCRRGANPVDFPPSTTPVLDSLTPNSLPTGSTPATIDVAGAGFDASSVIYADTDPRATFFITPTHLQYTARPDLVTAPETRQITVHGDSGTSNALTFTFT